MPARPVPPPDPLLSSLGLEKHKRDTDAHPIFSDDELQALHDGLNAYLAILPKGNIYEPLVKRTLDKVQEARLAR